MFTFQMLIMIQCYDLLPAYGFLTDGLTITLTDHSKIQAFQDYFVKIQGL